MLNKIYFCLFCPQKFETSDENVVKKHLTNKHFEAKESPIIKEWVESLVNYQTDLNRCLSSEPKSLPNSSMCQRFENYGKQKLLKGCALCDRIIQSFKLDIDLVKKRKNVCICGGGREVNKVVVICHQCKHLYHYSCIEPTDYSGEETSLYKCFKCKPKNFEISDLSSESGKLQPIHVCHHLNYRPFVCKFVSCNEGRTLVCKESFFHQSFLKTHLKSEHNLTLNENQISNYYDLHSIPKVQHLIDFSLKKIQNPNYQSVGQSSSQNSSVQNKRQSQEISENLMTNKRLRIETDIQPNGSNDRKGSGEQTRDDHYSNVASCSRSNTEPPFMSPPVLVNQSNFNDPNTLHDIHVPVKRGRGRPKGSKKSNGYRLTPNSAQSRTTNGKKAIPPNHYVADGNPQLKSRLSLQSRMSRPNISLSREQERALHNKRSKTIGNKSAAHPIINGGNDSSDWDSDTEKFETIRRSEHRVFESITLNTQNQKLPVDSTQSGDSVVGGSSQQIQYASASSGSPSNVTQQSPLKQTIVNSLNCEEVVETPSESEESIIDLSDRRQETRSVTNDNVDDQQREEEPEIIRCDQHTTNEEPITQNRPVLVTQITRAEDSNHPFDTQPEAEVIFNPDLNLVSEEPIVNQSSSHSDWLTHTKPKKFPYFPQISDEVVYIPYGHRLYIDAVRTLGLYKQTNPTKYVNSEYINEVLFAKIKEIRFEKQKKVRLTRLSLILIENGVETNRSFCVKFHDIDNVLDFIILKQTYNNSLMRNWKIADSFRAIIDDKWWFGEIHSYNMTENSMRTQFQVLNIVWGNGTTDILSFWDLEPILGELPQNKNFSIDVTDEDRSLFYTSEVKEWPVNGKAEECKRIANGLAQIMDLNEYKELMEVFSPSNPQFMDGVPYLINLSIIRSRVQNLFYRRHPAIKYDIKFLESNASILDPSGVTDVVRNARIVVSVCLKFIDWHKTNDIQHIYSRVMEDPKNLSKIKYYACSRPYMNPNPNIINPLIASTCAQILAPNGAEGTMNILTPSTTRPIINQIRRSNDSEISVIELSDSDEDKDEGTPEQRIQEMVDQMDEYVVSPTAPDTPPPPPLLYPVDLSVKDQPRPPSQTSRPVLSVVPLPIEERLRQKSPDLFKRYFCIFCTEKFFDRNEAMDHYCDELKIKLKCSQCPQNLNFESLDLYLTHNSEHIKQMKRSINSKTYSNGKAWIESLIEYMDSLVDPITAQNQIHPKFGDCCIVCQRLNLLTPDSQPFYHKKVFANNRTSMKSHLRGEVEFAQHMRKHLKYQPVYNCTLCAISKSNPVFSSTEMDENCRQHLQTDHQIELHSIQASDVTSFFGNTKIPDIDNIIPDAVNLFIVNYSNW